MLSFNIIRILIIICFIFFGYNIIYIIITKKGNKKNKYNEPDEEKKYIKNSNSFAQFGIITLNIFITIACLNIFFFEVFSAYIPKFNFSILGEIFQIIGFTLAIGGNITLALSYRELGVYWDYPIDSKTHKKRLVKTGIYSKIRHPIYMSFYLVCFGFWLMIQDILLLGLFIIGAIGLYIQALYEEKILLILFKDEYEAYMKNTGRFFARI